MFHYTIIVHLFAIGNGKQPFCTKKRGKFIILQLYFAAVSATLVEAERFLYTRNVCL